MSGKKTRKVLACVCAIAMLSGSVSAPIMSVSAGQVLGETDFEYKLLPWHICQSSPANQHFELQDGALHVYILTAEGADREKWDLQLRCRNLNFKAGHTYKVSFKAKAKREGMELSTRIGNIRGDEEYFVINEDKMQMGPQMGGQLGKAAELTTEWKEYSGIFTPDKNIEGAEWAFHYARGTMFEGNAHNGDEIWFDDMSIESDSPDDAANPLESYGAVSRDWGAKSIGPDTYMPDGKLNNYISVNQIGYYSNLAKIAVLGDNKGDITHDHSTIDLSKSSYDFDIIDAKSGKVAYRGTSCKKISNDKDSGDTVFKLDFTEFTTPGRYYVQVGDWRSYEFSIGDNIYSDDKHDMLTNALNYFYQNRSGIDIQADYITSGDKSALAHKGGHKTDTASVQKIWKNEYFTKEDATSTYGSSDITAPGGWYDACDYGKSVINGGISVWILQNMYERAIATENSKKKFADGSGTVVIPETANKVPDILDETAYEIDWMTKMVVQPDEPTWGKYAGLVYHKLNDHRWTGLATRPWKYEEEWSTVRIVKPPTFAATLNYAACAAQAARLWKPYDEKKSAFYFDEAKKAYEAYEKYWYEESDNESLYEHLFESIGSEPAVKSDIRDEAYWAACELFVSAKEMNDPAADDYYAKLSEYNDAFYVTSRITGDRNSDDTLSSFDCNAIGAAGSLTLALHKDLLSEKEREKIEKSIIDAADKYIDTENQQGYGIPYIYDAPITYNTDIIGYESNSNSIVMNNAIVMAYAYDQTKKVKYINGVTTAMDYILGTNPLSFSYITGYGTYHEQNPGHNYWANELDRTLPKAPDGVLSSGPNAGLQDEYVRDFGLIAGLSNPSQRCFVDSVESWSTNEAALNWNSPLAWVASFLQDEAGKSSTEDPVTSTVTEGPTTSAQVTEKTSAATSATGNPVTEKTSATISVTETQDKSFMYGDIDENGKVEITDLSCLSLYLLDDYTLTGNALKAADVNDDGKADLADLAHLKQFICKDPVTLGPKK